MNRTAVIILHFGNPDITSECLSSLYSNKGKTDFLIVLVDNSDNFPPSLMKKYPDVTIITNRQNTGFAQGNNRGINYALERGCDYMLLLNNDTTVEKNFIGKIVNFARKDNRIGLVSPKIYFAPGCEYHQDKYNNEQRGKVIWYAGGVLDWDNCYASHRGVDAVDEGQFDNIIETNFITGCCMLIARKVIEKIGLFDEKYFLYFEDVDYSIRARKNGFKTYYYPSAHLWHKNAATSGKPGSSTHIYYQTRNRLYFGFKYAPILTKKSLFLESLHFLFKKDPYRQAILDYYSGNMCKRKI